MSNALSYSYCGSERTSKLSSGLELESDSYGDHACEAASLSPAAFLHEAMQSTRNLLALSTVARLILDRERRNGEATRCTGTAYSHAQCREDGQAPSSQENGLGQFFSRLQQEHRTEDDHGHLYFRIRELEASLKRIEMSDLPDTTKDTVRSRVREQVELLRQRHNDAHGMTTE